MTNNDHAVPALSLRNITKTFGTAKALDRAKLEVWPGEIVGLLGANGSGKSTLIKVLAGFHAPDEGEGEIAGRPISFPLTGARCHELGLRFVHQDLGLVGSLTVLENLLIEDLAVSRDLRVSWRREREQARRLLRSHGLDIDPGRTVEDLAPVERAMLAVVRATKAFALPPGDEAALSTREGGHGALVLDEPTVFLSEDERTLLFELVRRLAERQVAVVFVSHDLSEVRELCERVVVLRDGRVAGEADLATVADEAVIRLIVGGEMRVFNRESATASDGPKGLAVADVSGGGSVGVSLSAAHGEILGITGLAGSGFESMPYLLYGAVPATAGEMVHGGTTFDVTNLTPRASMANGIVLIPADRAADAVVGELSLAENLSLPTIDRFYVRGWMRGGRLMRACTDLLDRFRVKPRDPNAAMSALSGGNQQRALLAKWLQLKPRLLLLHEPTQGVDVAARQDIFRLLRAAAEDGMTVICASSDYEQLGLLADRVLIFRAGHPVDELRGDDVTKDHITEACLAAPSADPVAEGSG